MRRDHVLTRHVIVALAMACLGAVACSSEKNRTELILGVATDLAAPRPLTDVEMHVFRLPENVEVGNQTFTISGTLNQDYELPGTYDVYSPTGTADRVRVVLDGHDATSALLVERTAVLTMVPGRTLFVRLGVVSACEGMNDCPGGDTCIEGRCQSEDIDTTLLPDYTPGMEKTIACLSATTFVDTSTKQALPLVSTADGGAPCGQGSCAEGVCLAAAPGTFSPTKGPLTRNRVASMQIGGKLITLDDGRVLFVGGLAAGTSATLKAAELYDPTTQTFSATGDLTTPRAYYAAAKVAGGRVLVAGGINDAGAALATAELYDPATGTFTTTKTPMNVARVFPSAATLADGRALIVGGMNQIQSYVGGSVNYTGGLAAAEIYDPVTDTFTPTGSLVESRGFAQVIPVAGGALVLCGSFQGGARSTIERFDAAMGAFGATPTPGPAGAGPCIPGENALLPDGTVLVTTSPNGAWLFDPTAATFRPVAPHPGAAPGGLAATLDDGDVLFAGDFATGQGVGTRAYVFDFQTQTFEFVAGDLSVARASFMSALLEDGDVLIAGGADTSAEIFHRPASP
jgi:hypothetical protein